MPAAAVPRHEAKRLVAVRQLGLVGTPAEERFDKITRLAKRAFNVPIAIVDIVAEKRVWLKSVQGIDMTEGDLPTSYCTHAILSDDICLIEDALRDERTSDNPYASTFRFYAGMPLHFEGERIGVFCVAGHEPRTLSEDDQLTLADLARMVERELCIASLSEVQRALAKENEELASKALVDGLTHLWNRSAISEIAARELEHASESESPTGFILLDLDHFKNVNDVHGHQAGDEVLRQVAERMRRTVRPYDAVGRWGGEEFLAVLPSCSSDHVMVAAERIRAEICAEPVKFNCKDIDVTASFGCSVSHDGRQFVAHLVKAADDALYKAKAEGRNRLSFKKVTPSILAMPAVKETVGDE